LVSEKGTFDLLAAYDALAPQVRKEVGLVFVGDGAARAALQRRAKAINPGSIHFAGFVQREQLPAYYALADALVFPTHTDPWGLVVNEAMACGLPVISTFAAGCVADLVENRWNGRLVSAGDVGQLTTAMDELARDAGLRSLMGQRSRERIRQYSPAAWAAGVANAVLPRARRAA
jgi:glycosyltransferase involved in cell wall biosynthesis